MMTSEERVALASNHEEADRIPYDQAGTTVTSINKYAYQAAMEARGMSTEYHEDEVDPISQKVTLTEENLVALKSDTRRIGSMRIPEYHLRKRVNGKSTKEAFANKKIRKNRTMNESIFRLFRTVWFFTCSLAQLVLCNLHIIRNIKAPTIISIRHIVLFESEFYLTWNVSSIERNCKEGLCNIDWSVDCKPNCNING